MIVPPDLYRYRESSKVVLSEQNLSKLGVTPGYEIADADSADIDFLEGVNYYYLPEHKEGDSFSPDDQEGHVATLPTVVVMLADGFSFGGIKTGTLRLEAMFWDAFAASLRSFGVCPIYIPASTLADYSSNVEQDKIYVAVPWATTNPGFNNNDSLLTTLSKVLKP